VLPIVLRINIHVERIDNSQREHAQRILFVLRSKGKTCNLLEFKSKNDEISVRAEDHLNLHNFTLYLI
jgi:hypothetical protein